MPFNFTDDYLDETEFPSKYCPSFVLLAEILKYAHTTHTNPIER